MQGAQPLGVIMTAPRRFAVHGKDRLVSAAGRGRLGAQGLQPVAEASLKRGRVEKHQHAAKDILAGNAGRQGQHLPEKVLLGAGPAGNRGGAAGTGEHGHQRNDHHAHQGMLAIDGRTRILQRVEMSDDLVHRHAGKLGHDPSSVGCSTACHTENDLKTTASRRKPPYLARITQKYALALGDQYTGLDRFGRVVEVNWYNTSTHSSTDDFQYGYDQDNNVLYKDNTLDSSMSELYHTSGSGNGYDGLNQLTAFARGTLSASQQGGQLDTVSNQSETESWTLDALGNFTTVTLNGAPTTETINQQNEVTADGSAGLTYDKNGNTLTDNNGNSFKYNAWNEIVSASNNGTTIASYSVDGLGRRATESEGGTLSDVYFSSAWQVVEEDVSGAMTNQYVYSPVYVNAMIERDTPTQRLYVQQDVAWNDSAVV